MQNGKSQFVNGFRSLSFVRSRCLARYRVMARRRQGSVGLVSLAESRWQAISLAEQFRERVLALRVNDARRRPEPDDILTLYLEEWIGTSVEGQWVRLSPEHGGFFHEFDARQPRRQQRLPSSGVHSGDRARCVLLAEKTRKGGWRARLLDRDLAGPVTNTADVPPAATPGQTVSLRIGTMDEAGRRVQFQWMADSLPKNGQK